MTDTPAPAPPCALRIHDLVVRAVVRDEAPATPSAPRDLPDLARFLFHALAPDVERQERVLKGVSLAVERGACLALVGEDGCGKTTLARTCARLVKPSSGSIHVDGKDIHRARGAGRREVRRALQVVFDDPESGLDPRRTVEQILVDADLALGLDVASRGARVRRALARARLDAGILDTRAGVLAAGPRRRAALARALLAEPSALVIDEPAGGLDPSDRALVLETLEDLQLLGPEAPALLVLTRDLAAARTLAQRAGVLKRGALVEVGEVDKVLETPEHPYAKSLVAAAPRVRLGG